MRGLLLLFLVENFEISGFLRIFEIFFDEEICWKFQLEVTIIKFYDQVKSTFCKSLD